MPLPPTADDIVLYVSDYYDENQEGPTRKEIADTFGWAQTRNIPGVRAAIDDGRIHYDGTRESRLVPSTGQSQDTKDEA